MKTRTVIVLVALACAGLPAFGLSGCAGSQLTKSTGEYIDDAALTAKVKAELFRDPIVSGMAVNVDTFKGVVQLNGFVDTPQQKTRAEQIARSVAGVASVQNKLSVKTNVTR
jgi:hyperosmotically inducible periplasmic protein